VLCILGEGSARLEKRVLFTLDGRITVGYAWDAGVAHPDDLFTTELSLGGPLEVRCTPVGEEWRFDIETVAKSERGLDRTRQGESITLRWPVHRGEAAVEIRPAG